MRQDFDLNWPRTIRPEDLSTPPRRCSSRERMFFSASSARVKGHNLEVRTKRVFVIYGVPLKRFRISKRSARRTDAPFLASVRT